MNQLNSSRPVGTVGIYGCGGGGTNLAKEYIADGHSGDVAKIQVALLDTSDSNLDDSLRQHAFLFANPNGETDGSGAMKAKNAELIERSMPEVLRKHPAQEMNIVITTASGGTGNVAAYYLIEALLKQKRELVVILIGTAEDERKAKNTLGTLSSLQNLVDEYKVPVIFHWGFNEPGTPRSGVDKEVHLMVTALCVLGSRRIHGFDKADLGSFLNYTVPRPDIEPSLARIRVFDTAAEFDKAIQEPLSAAYLLRSPDDAVPKAFAPYSTDGVLPAEALTKSEGLFFGIETKSLHKIQSDMEALRADLASREASRTKAPSFGGTGTGRGLVHD